MWYSVAVTGGLYKAMKNRNNTGESSLPETLIDLQNKASKIYSEIEYFGNTKDGIIMDYKVHRIIDGIMNVDANSKEDAEKIVQEKLQNFVKKADDLMNFFIAKSIQGQVYLPSNEENEKKIIQKGDDSFEAI